MNLTNLFPIKSPSERKDDSEQPRHGNFRLTQKTFFLLLAIPVLLLAPETFFAKQKSLSLGRPFIVEDKTFVEMAHSNSYEQKGHASWYGSSFHGHRTSSGERYNMHNLTAAHKTLPMDTVLIVKNLDNGKNALVRVNDRGPFADDRIIDLSYKAARRLGLVHNGTARVQITALTDGQGRQLEEPLTLPTSSPSTDEFYVQVGTFANMNNALKLQKRLAEAGQTAIIKQSSGSSDQLYRVNVLAGTDLQSAKVAEKSLSRNGFRDAFIVTR